VERSELRALGNRLLAEARALRSACLHDGVTRELPVSEVQKGTFADDAKALTLWAALGYLREEMVLVRDGKAGTLTVLDDEIAYTEELLRSL
jgi:hypothetical protein